jgi:hypothetical protein
VLFAIRVLKLIVKQLLAEPVVLRQHRSHHWVLPFWMQLELEQQIPILPAIEARITARQIMDMARMDHGGSRVPDALAIAAWEYLTSNHE